MVALISTINFFQVLMLEKLTFDFYDTKLITLFLKLQKIINNSTKNIFLFLRKKDLMLIKAIKRNKAQCSSSAKLHKTFRN